MILSFNTVKKESEYVKVEVANTDFMDQDIVTINISGIDDHHSSVLWLLTQEQAQDLKQKLEAL